MNGNRNNPSGVSHSFRVTFVSVTANAFKARRSAVRCKGLK